MWLSGSLVSAFVAGGRERLLAMHADAWRQTLQAADDGLELQPPADAGEIAAVELRLDITFAAELRGLYEATDGIFDKPGQWFVMWRLGEVARWNLDAWNGWESEARRKLLGFGDDGTGDPFCVALDGEPTIFTWSPIEQQARSLAPNLREFWLGWFSGQITT
ncbi:SMI1/KNR4 family protein [Kribbella shirazensis]|uniref:Cell wall assembly regulator SMI1 n=1 Tax=Kribbella shirazensis TaxID=1105143 RepID=A0A7X5VGP3_9ACTN|nr:SMI1/KNR4 family protein [Kribbella shirazensis]NIK60867.1 cell wall assembly regulator SMI1 [Kribbella shirazensis]